MLLRSLFITGPTVPVLRLEGVIQAGGRGGTRVINYANTFRLIDRAFAYPRSPAVALVINSPGGSAVQSHLIARKIIKLSEEKKKPVLAFVEDAAASGGYILALAAQEIYADPFSIVGSIGVIHASFGFTDAIKKLGIERRVETAGKNKSFLDPFSDLDEGDKRRLRTMLDGMHDKFKGFVKERRSNKLNGSDEVLFEGDFWLAEKAKELGLIDGLGDVRTVLQSRFGTNVSMPSITPRPLLFPMLGEFRSFSNFADSLEQTNQWKRYGL